jgi:phosphoglucomutase
VNTLTGFKYLGAKLRKYEEAIPVEKRGDYRARSEEETRALRLEYSKFFVFGGEESYGYLAGDFVRDKDGNASAVMFAELAACAMSEGRKVTDLLDELFREHGVHLEAGRSLVMEGADGAARIKGLVASYTADPPGEVDGSEVSVLRNFATEEIHDEEGDPVPKQGMIMVDLADGRRFAVRPSGTEPKIKYYLFGREDPAPGDLEGSKERVGEGLERLWKWLEADARRRMG